MCRHRPTDLAGKELRRAVWTFATVCAAGLASPQAYAQANSPSAPDNPYRSVNLNYVYAADLGFGGYSLAGLTVNVYTLPLSYTLRDVPVDGWGLRLLMPIETGVYSFRATDINGQRIALDQQSVSVVPGVELQIPLGKRVMLKPFAQFGVGYAFGSGVGNPESWIYLAGVRMLTQWRAGDYTFSLGNAAVFAGDDTIGPGFGERYVSLQIGGEVRRPLGFTVGDFTPDLGLYVANYYYPTPLEFSRFLRPPLRVVDQGEVGFSIGSARPLEILDGPIPASAPALCLAAD
jgi:hypothetical protein